MTRIALTALVTLTLMPIIGALAQGVPKDFVITMERTTCFGSCPAYQVSIDADGNVIYRGDQSVRVKGQMTASIPRAQVAALASTVERIGFFALQDSYTALITDLPTTTVTITRNGVTKRIVDYFGAPDSLREFEALIDRTAGTGRWIRIDRLTLERMFREGRPPLPAQQRLMLDAALTADEVDVVETLVAHGVDLSTAKDEPPFLHLAKSGAAARALIEAGADVNEQMRGGYGTPLYSAATERADLTAALIRAGARIDLQARDGGATPLYKASCAGNAAVVKLLLAAGANATTRFAGDRTALDCALDGQRKAMESTGYPRDWKLPYDEDYPGVIALLEAAVARAKPQP